MWLHVFVICSQHSRGKFWVIKAWFCSSWFARLSSVLVRASVERGSQTAWAQQFHSKVAWCRKHFFFSCCSTSNITQLCFEMHCTAAVRDQWASLINLVFLSMWKDTDSPAFHFLLVVSALCGTNSWICQHCVGSLYLDLLQTIWEASPASPRAQAVKVNFWPHCKSAGWTSCP